MNPVRAIVFDWDGTSVEDRSQDIAELASLLGRAIDLGIVCVVITGTSLEKLRAQGIERVLENAPEGALYLCTNRGSEVFALRSNGGATLLHRRLASALELSRLDAAADAIAERLRRAGLESVIIRDRLNRRKIDLIPEPGWADPKKAQFKELLEAVEGRLSSAAPSTALRDVIAEARATAVAVGLSGAKVTSDIKHVEIGLTDKADSARWVAVELLRAQGIESADVLIVGDELGSIGGSPGSDSLFRIPELAGATFVSVGVEPQGAPEGVLHFPGGPQRFLELLKEQIRLASRAALLESLDSDPAWSLEQEGFDPSQELDLEALFSLANGVMGLRGALSLPIPSSQTDFFIAGLYDRKSAATPYSEIEFLEPDDSPEDSGDGGEVHAEIVSFPAPVELSLRLPDRELRVEDSQIERFRRVLDFKNAVVHERFSWSLPHSEIALRVARSVSMSRERLLLQELEISVEGEPVRLELHFQPAGSELIARHPQLVARTASDPGMIHYESAHSRIRTTIGWKSWLDGKRIEPSPRLSVEARPGQAVVVHRAFVVRTARETENPADAAREELGALTLCMLQTSFRQHQREWGSFWKSCDIEFPGRPELTEAMRFNAFQLRSSASRDGATSITARGFTGRAYEGHVFWDTEAFMFPLLLHADAGLARACLDYRYNTLEGARRHARKLGCGGACFAWESTVTGADVTPRRLLMKTAGKTIPIFTGMQQIHVTGDVAYAIARYWAAAQDLDWMRARGLPILVETARFWVTRVTERDGFYSILKVVGPDEYHHDVDDNAFTNWMAKFNLELAIAWAKRLQESGARLGVRSPELRRWEKVAARIYFPEPDGRGVIEQFRGFFGLKPVTIRHEEVLRAPLDRLLNWEEVDRLQIVKQADVLMIPYLFPGALPEEVVRACYEYYYPRTDHGSSLSPAVHATVAAQIGKRVDARRLWETSLHIDLLNLMRNTALGLHLGSMGANWRFARECRQVFLEEGGSRCEDDQRTA